MRTNPREILGRGWAFPFGFDSATGSVAVSEFEENIRQNITIIIGTKPGERQMLPAFGCRIHELMFAPNTRNTSAIVSHHVEEALARWEPRIAVLKVTADADATGSIKVEVEYKIVATDSVSNLVLAIGG